MCVCVNILYRSIYQKNNDFRTHLHIHSSEYIYIHIYIYIGLMCYIIAEGFFYMNYVMPGSDGLRILEFEKKQ